MNQIKPVEATDMLKNAPPIMLKKFQQQKVFETSMDPGIRKSILNSAFIEEDKLFVKKRNFYSYFFFFFFLKKKKQQSNKLKILILSIP